MKVLVTGATGLIGAHAIASLREHGHAVRVFVRDPSKLGRVFDPLGVDVDALEVARGDLEDHASLARAVEGTSGLLHAAGLFSPDPRAAERVRRVNVDGTRTVLEVAEGAALERIVYVSSILALFPPAGPIVHADDPVASPREMYAATKAHAERLARAAQPRLPLSIVAPAAVQGPHDPTFSIGPQLVANALRDGRVLVTEGGLPTTDVRDLARVLVAVLEGRSTATRLMAPAFFVAHDAYHALLERVTGRTLAAQRLPGWVLRAMGRVGDVVGQLGRPVQLTSEAAAVLTRSVPVDDAEACRLLGREPIGPEASFRDLIRWMVEAGHLDAASAGRAAP